MDVECRSFIVEKDLLFITVYVSVEEHMFFFNNIRTWERSDTVSTKEY